jgi:hypothetical protein
MDYLLIAQVGLSLFSVAALSIIIGQIVKIRKIQKKSIRNQDPKLNVNVNYPDTKVMNFFSYPRVRQHLETLVSEKPLACSTSFALENIARTIEEKMPDANNSVCVCSVAIGDQYRKVVQLCLSSQRDYAHNNKFDYFHLTEIPPFCERAASWIKIPMIFA